MSLLSGSDDATLDADGVAKLIISHVLNEFKNKVRLWNETLCVSFNKSSNNLDGAVADRGGV